MRLGFLSESDRIVRISVRRSKLVRGVAWRGMVRRCLVWQGLVFDTLGLYSYAATVYFLLTVRGYLHKEYS